MIRYCAQEALPAFKTTLELKIIRPTIHFTKVNFVEAATSNEPVAPHQLRKVIQFFSVGTAAANEDIFFGKFVYHNL